MSPCLKMVAPPQPPSMTGQPWVSSDVSLFGIVEWWPLLGRRRRMRRQEKEEEEEEEEEEEGGRMSDHGREED